MFNQSFRRTWHKCQKKVWNSSKTSKILLNSIITLKYNYETKSISETIKNKELLGWDFCASIISMVPYVTTWVWGKLYKYLS